MNEDLEKLGITDKHTNENLDFLLQKYFLKKVLTMGLPRVTMGLPTREMGQGWKGPSPSSLTKRGLDRWAGNGKAQHSVAKRRDRKTTGIVKGATG